LWRFIATMRAMRVPGRNGRSVLANLNRAQARALQFRYVKAVMRMLCGKSRKRASTLRSEIPARASPFSLWNDSIGANRNAARRLRMARRMRRARERSLVCGGFLGVVDHEKGNGPFGRFEFQSQLLLHGCEKRWAAGGGCRPLVFGPIQSERVASFQTGLINDGAVQPPG